MKVKSSLPLAAAEKIVDAALAAGTAHQMMPLTVVVLDKWWTHGRDETPGRLRQHARRCRNREGLGRAGYGASEPIDTRQAGGWPAFKGALSAVSDGRFVPVPGGVLISDAEGFAIGAVGISGDTSDKDEFCAIEGIKAAGMVPDPLDPVADWANSKL